MDYGFSWIIVVYHWITVDSNGLWTISACRGLSWFDMDYHGLFWILTEHGLSWGTVDYHRVSPIGVTSWSIMDFHGVPRTVVDYHGL